MRGIVLHVRQGFEDDAAKEVSSRLAAFGVKPASVISKTDTALVIIHLADDDQSVARKNLAFGDLIFARQLLWSCGTATLPHDGDRVTPMIDVVKSQVLDSCGSNAFSGFAMETPDTDSSKELTGFCKSLSRPLENTLNKLKLLPRGKGAAHLPRLHLVMLSNTEVLATFADPENSSPWPMGIPRLRFPPNAPSRSTLKLEEAFHVFLGADHLKDHLKPGMTAVDLGACPGGWTYQLVKHGMHTTAIDNGSIDSRLMSSGLVTHLREDAFTFRPYDTVDWMVCDVVEQPSRITELMTDWFVHDHCRNAIFNLKLPMKRRFEEVEQCLAQLKAGCRAAGKVVQIRAKHLYHDRKEITVFATATGS